MPEQIAKQQFNVSIGQRIQRRRKELGLSQTALGVKIGLSCQQIQKYENGQTRISASRLFDLSTALGTSVPALIGVGDEGRPTTSRNEAERLLEAWGRIPEAQRTPLLRHIEAMALDPPDGYGE